MTAMSRARYMQLNSRESGRLTAEEMRAGWHFCYEWDYMLTNMNDQVGETCTCKPWSEQEIAAATKET